MMVDTKALESKASEALSFYLKSDPVQNAFSNLFDVEYYQNVGVAGKSKVCDILKGIFEEESKLSEASGAKNSDPMQLKNEANECTPVQEFVINYLVTELSTRNNVAKAEFITNVLYQLCKQKHIPAKSVCYMLMKHDELTPDKTTFWLVTFQLVCKIILLVDYKGVREIMKLCIEKSRLLPARIKKSEMEKVECLVSLMEIILDRGTSLLPGYFIVTELLKFFPECNDWPHWRLSKLLSSFVDDFRKPAQILSIMGQHRLRPVVGHSAHSSQSINSWKIVANTLKFPLKGALPYAPSLQKPQYGLLRHVFHQTSSREIIMTMLDLQKKQVSPVIENQLAEVFIESLEECIRLDSMNHSQENNGASPTNPASQPTEGSTSETLDVSSTCQCNHMTSLLIFFVLNQLITFKSIVQCLYSKLEKRKDVHAGRHHLMWSLLQFLSGTVTKFPAADFQPVLRLIELLYPEQNAIPVPHCFDQRCAFALAPMCILIHVMKKAQVDNIKVPQSIPPAFTRHHELLQSFVHNPQIPLPPASGYSQSAPDFRLSLILNAYSTNTEIFHRLATVILEHMQGSAKSTVSMPGTNCLALGSTIPIKISFLDTLTIHVKMSIIHSIVTHINKHSQSKSTVALAPSMVETYARLLAYSETESIGLKQYSHQLLPLIYKNGSWGIFHTLIEMFTYRIPHSPPQYKMHLLSTIHHMSIGLNNMPNMNQLHLCMESCALRLINGLGNNEVMPNLTRFFTNTDSKLTVISTESEELNRVLVLTLARAIHVTGCVTSAESNRWCLDFLKAVMAQTPHTWASHTLNCFPPVIADFYKQYGASRDNVNLKEAVEDEFVKWKSMNSESDFLAHFPLQSQSSSNLFLCLLFKMVFETSRVPAEAYKILDRLGPRQLMAHVRTLCDFLVLEFSNSSLGQHLSKCVDTMNAIIWQYNIIPIDRLILCLVLRTQVQVQEAQVCLFIIQLLLLRPVDFRNRVQDFVNDNSPEHWKQSNWYEKHMAFHRKFPENFTPLSMREGQGSLSSQQQTLPIYFTNVCLRFLPVLDIMIHRFLEVHQVHKRLETLLENLGSLYKFHDRPITYLYNTLHYYDEKLRESHVLKRQLVGAVIMSQKDIKPAGWALTDEYITYLASNLEESNWEPSSKYFVNILKRMVKTIKSPLSVFPTFEPKFNEFANPADHCIHITCVELMALPIHPTAVANNLINSVIKGPGLYDIASHEIMDWINSIGLILSYLPDSFSTVIHDKIVHLLQIPELTVDRLESLNPFMLMNLEELLPTMINVGPVLTVAVVHSFWHHSSVCQVAKIVSLMRDKIIPVLKTEEQYIVLLHIVAPFLQRLNLELSRKVFDLIVELAQALAVVDRNVAELKYQDTICDILYHIKYMFTGDRTKAALEDIIRKLRPSLQLKLRFITHLNIEEIESGISSGTNEPAANEVTVATTLSAAIASGNIPSIQPTQV